MRKLSILIGFLLFATPALADCQDDPRIAELPGMLASGALPEKPFYLTPETYIRLQPDVREALGDSIIICPKTPVKNHLPVYPPRLPLDFNVIWDVMDEAINLDDWKNVEWLRDHTKAPTLAPEAVFSLLVVPLLSVNTSKRLATLLSMSIEPPLDNPDKLALPSPLFLADVFAALGGKANGKATIVWSSNMEKLDAARSRAAGLNLQGFFFKPYSGYAIERAQHAMGKFGIELLNADKFLRMYK